MHPARARVLEAAALAAHAEGHVALLRADAELGEQPQQGGVGALVVDDEARVEGRPRARRRPRTATVFACPPRRSSRSNSVTSCVRPRMWAAVSPATPLPTTATRSALTAAPAARARAAARTPPQALVHRLEPQRPSTNRRVSDVPERQPLEHRVPGPGELEPGQPGGGLAGAAAELERAGRVGDPVAGAVHEHHGAARQLPHRLVRRAPGGQACHRRHPPCPAARRAARAPIEWPTRHTAAPKRSESCSIAHSTSRRGHRRCSRRRGSAAARRRGRPRRGPARSPANGNMRRAGERRFASRGPRCCGTCRRVRSGRPRAPGHGRTGLRARETRHRLSSRSLRCYRFVPRGRLDRFHLQGGGQTAASCVRWMCTPSLLDDSDGTRQRTASRT